MKGLVIAFPNSCTLSMPGKRFAANSFGEKAPGQRVVFCIAVAKVRRGNRRPTRVTIQALDPEGLGTYPEHTVIS